MYNSFRNLFFLFLIATFCISSPSFSQEEVKKSEFLTFLPSVFSRNNEIVIEPWNSPAGIKRLENSKYKNDFYELAGFFQAQTNPLYCGVASSVIVLNAIRSKSDKTPDQLALEVKKPFFMSGSSFMAFKTYSQHTFLNSRTDKIKDRNVINLRNIADGKAKIDPGFNLRQLTDVLRKVYDLKVEIYYVGKPDKKRIAQFRNLVKRVVADHKYYIVANFYGRALGLKTGGHISPIAAYNEKSDSILVLDVAGHHNPWYWVKVVDFYQSMNTKDADMNRGYLIISDK